MADEESTTTKPKPTSNPTSFYFLLLFLLPLPLLLLLSKPPTPFLTTLPPTLHRHHSSGQLLPPHNLFVLHSGPSNASNTLLLLHPLASSSFLFRHLLPLLPFRSLSLDLPGHGFSDPLHPPNPHFFQKIVNVFREIKQKGVFWGFDQIVENGFVPFEEKQDDSSSRVLELGWVLEEVIDAFDLAPVHLVVHDSALPVFAGFVSSRSDLVRSVTIVDSSSESAAFPSWMLGVPVLGDVLLRSRWMFGGLLRVCCARGVDEESAEAYRLMLRRDGVRDAVTEFGRGLNFSFDVGEWAGGVGVRDLPVQVLWSHMTSDYWIEEGRRVAKAVPRARFVPHLGGRWAEEGAAKEIADMITEFVLSLSKTDRQVEKETQPEQVVKNVVDELVDGH